MSGSGKVDRQAVEKFQQEVAELAARKEGSNPDSVTTSGSGITHHPGQQASSALLAGRIEQANRLREEYRKRLSEEYGREIRCVACHDTGRYPHDHRPCGCDRGKKIAEIDESNRIRGWIESVPDAVGIPAAFRDSQLSTHPDQDNTAVKLFRSWVENHAAGHTRPSVYIHGDFGVGKTGLACGALSELVMGVGISTGYSVAPGALGRFTTATGMMDSLRDFEGRNGPDATTMAATLNGIRWLVIDDFGAERLTEWGVDRLFNVINERHVQQRTMIITSNYSLDQMIDKIAREVNDLYGRRIVERLQQSCDVIRFPQNSRNLRRG